MACSRGKADPNDQTRYRLYSACAGYCQKPDCNKYLFHDFEKNKSIHFSEIAHIISASKKGPRANEELTAEEKGGYDNLIILCSNCHALIDKAEEDFPEEVIIKWKKSSSEKVKSIMELPHCEDRASAKKFVENIFSENKHIFDTYGPKNDMNLNPETDLPQIWKRKILSIIIPNNRKLLTFIEIHSSLLISSEKDVFNRFKQHIDDFEQKHLFNSNTSGELFPREITNIFGGA